MKIIFSILFLANFLFASYAIKYKGITLGKIQTLDTLKEGYLKAKVTNIIVKMLLRKKYYVFYENKKPNIQDAKFKHDGKKILFALKKALKNKPKYEEFIIDPKRKIILECKSNKCIFNYFSNKENSASGVIEFKNNEFFRLYEKNTTLEIIKDNS